EGGSLCSFARIPAFAAESRQWGSTLFSLPSAATLDYFIRLRFRGRTLSGCCVPVTFIFVDTLPSSSPYLKLYASVCICCLIRCAAVSQPLRSPLACRKNLEEVPCLRPLNYGWNRLRP